MKSLEYALCSISSTVERPYITSAREADIPKATPAMPQQEPTSKIREIIKQYNSRPQPEPRPFEPVRSVFVKTAEQKSQHAQLKKTKDSKGKGAIVMQTYGDFAEV